MSPSDMLQLFDRTTTKLLRQNRRCGIFEDDTFFPKYKHAGACGPIGFIMGNNYSLEFEGYSFYQNQLIHDAVAAAIGLGTIRPNVARFLTDLQAIHDEYCAVEWRQEFGSMRKDIQSGRYRRPKRFRWPIRQLHYERTYT